MSPVRSLVSPLAMLALAAPPLLVAPTASPAGTAITPTCFGDPATIIGDGYLRGTPRADVVVATSTATEVHSLGGDDRICGAFLVYAGSGSDRIYYDGRRGEVELRGGDGADRVVSLSGGSYLYGGRGPDVLIGGRGVQWMSGERGHDRIYAGSGDDHLFGGSGRDRADGGPGDDVCSAEKRISCDR